MTDLRSRLPEELSAALAPLNLPAFRAKQIFHWLQRHGVSSFDEMTNLPKALRQKLSEQFLITHCEIARRQTSKQDGTVKYLFRLHDEEAIESVVMRYEHGCSICVSSQVGCKMG